MSWPLGSRAATLACGRCSPPSGSLLSSANWSPDSVPGLVTISLIVLTVQTVVAIATGNLLIFLVHFPVANLGLCLLFAWTARGHSPIAGRLAAEVIGLRCPAVHQPCLNRFFRNVTILWAGVFLLLAVTLGALLATIPVGTYVPPGRPPPSYSSPPGSPPPPCGFARSCAGPASASGSRWFPPRADPRPWAACRRRWAVHGVGDAQRQTWNGSAPALVWTVQEPSLRKLAAVA